uniref:NADH dehydrogenase subunit 2 n=1 Tax=Hydroptila angulata TaxID=1875522 RepID=UPI0022DCD8E1|nr:NADH dehydrogenase subunit 2 [Hydroptila angulata]UZZ44039.1 NADH dehydrogenase subunit 2 [Hydroptila angulata]
MNYVNWNKMLFILILIVSSLYAISTNSLINCWMGLELNLMAFIYLSHKNLNLMSKISIKYFLIQSLASMNFLFIIMMMEMNFHLSFYMIPFNQIMIMMINMMMLIKMGAAPFHWWFPMVSEMLDWNNLLILFTWQKLIPMVIIMYYSNLYLIILASIMSALIGAYSGLNQTSLRKILSYSSINHMSWMLINIMMNLNLWKLYFLVYSYMNYMIIYFFNKMNLSFLNQMFFLKIKLSLKIMILLNLLSLGGIPPFLGFMSKWLSIKFLMMYLNNQFFILLLIMCSLITLFYYLQISYSSILLLNYKIANKIMLMNKKFLIMKINITSWILLNFVSIMFMLN